MTTRTFRFQADINAAGQFVSGSLFDQQTVVDAITDAEIGAQVIGPTTLTNQTHPALFAALNALTAKTAERVQAKRDALAAVATPTER